MLLLMMVMMMMIKMIYGPKVTTAKMLHAVIAHETIA